MTVSSCCGSSCTAARLQLNSPPEQFLFHCIANTPPAIKKRRTSRIAPRMVRFAVSRREDCIRITPFSRCSAPGRMVRRHCFRRRSHRSLLCGEVNRLCLYLSGCPYRFKATPHNSACRYGGRGVPAAKQKAQIILCAAKVSAACGGCSEPEQGQRSQSASRAQHDAGTATRHYRAFLRRRWCASFVRALGFGAWGHI